MRMIEEPAFITIPIETYRAILNEVQALKARVDALESHQLDDTARLARDIALDRQRLTKLERTEPQPLQKDRGEILRALIAANGGKMLAKDARQKMHLSRSRFSELLALMGDYIDTKPYYLNKSAKILILK
jgi:uncharacterized membrane protein